MRCSWARSQKKHMRTIKCLFTCYCNHMPPKHAWNRFENGFYLPRKNHKQTYIGRERTVARFIGHLSKRKNLIVRLLGSSVPRRAANSELHRVPHEKKRKWYAKTCIKHVFYPFTKISKTESLFSLLFLGRRD